MWTGSFINKYAGSDIRPPPPAMESTKPARKTKTQIISSALNVISIMHTPTFHAIKNPKG